MEFFIGAVVVILIVLWIRRTRRNDNLTMLSFDNWTTVFDSANPFQQTEMAVAFLAQSVHFASAVGVINLGQQELVTTSLKKQPATDTLMKWLDAEMPYVVNVVGIRMLKASPARLAGMLLLVAWMSPTNEKEEAVRYAAGRI